ncbi:hypothetical protein [Labrenzia sp. OB1]|nr:hypothetical protein [Labrenzia sp. OB1]
MTADRGAPTFPIPDMASRTRDSLRSSCTAVTMAHAIVARQTR